MVMNRTTLFSFMFFYYCGLHAADIPLYVIDSEKTKQEMCIQNERDDCVSSYCTASSDLNCSDDCVTKATNKCLGRGGDDLCVQKKTDACIQDICVTSLETDCTDTCRQHASYQCKENQEETQN